MVQIRYILYKCKLHLKKFAQYIFIIKISALILSKDLVDQLET